MTVNEVIGKEDRIEVDFNEFARGGDWAYAEVFFNGDLVGTFLSKVRGPSRFTNVEDEDLLDKAHEAADAFGTAESPFGFEVNVDLELIIDGLLDEF